MRRGGGLWYNVRHLNGEKAQMPITLTAPPAVVEGARSYAERSGMTLEAFVLAYLESVAKRERERRKESFYNAELAKLAGTWVPDPEAEKVFEEMRTIDEEMWKWAN